MSVELMDNRIIKTQENENDLAWQQVLCELHKKFGEAIFKSWFSKITLISILGKKATLGVPTQFIRDWIKTNYQEQILKIFSTIYPEILSIELLITHSSSHYTIPFEPAAEILEESKSADAIFTSQLDPRFTFKNFVVGSPNELAYAASWAVAESKESIKESNPLFLYGGVGLGKTHLMHAIAWHIKITNPKRKVIYMSAEKFMYKFVSALRNKDVMSFKEQFRSIDVLMIDDIQFICGKESTQEEFFHTFNALIDNNRQMVISCDRSPTDLDNIEDRIKSRLGWGLVADVHSTTYELRLGILASKIEQLGVSVPQNVIEFLASKIVSNVRELEGALNKVIAHSKLVGRNITIESCQSILKDLLRSNEKYITIEEIQKKVAERYNIKVSDMSSTRRIRSIARPRQIAMYLAKSLTTKSLNDIGKLFGKKDHTTVMHACKQVEKLKLSDKGLEEEISLLARVLQG